MPVPKEVTRPSMMVRMGIIDNEPIKCRNRKFLEFLCASTIFVLTLLSIVMRGFISNDNPAVFDSYGDYYIAYWFPLFVYLMMFVVAMFFLIKAWVFKSCVYAKIASTSFAVAKTMSLVQMIFLFDWMFYITIWDFVMRIGVIATSVMWVVSVIIRKLRDD